MTEKIFRFNLDGPDKLCLSFSVEQWEEWKKDIDALIAIETRKRDSEAFIINDIQPGFLTDDTQ